MDDRTEVEQGGSAVSRRGILGAFAAFAADVLPPGVRIERIYDRSVLVDNLNGADATVATLQAQGFSHQQAAGVLESLVAGQSSAMAVGHLFAVVSIVFFIAASFIWLAPRPPKDASAAGAH